MRYGLARGFSRSSVHTVAVPTSGRHGADGAAGGLFAAAPQGRSVLVSTLPLAGGTKWRWVAISLCLYPLQCVAVKSRPLAAGLFHPFTLPPTNGAARSAAARSRTPFGPSGRRAAISVSRPPVPQKPIKPRLPPRAARRQDHTRPMVPPHSAANHVVSALSPACGRRDSVDGKPLISASQSISPPTPLAP